jgi:thioredoxin 1
MSFVVNERSFEKEVLEASRPVLVHFWAPWCGLCRAIDPLLEKWQQEVGSSIELVSIDADRNFKLANTYRLRNLPTLLLFDRGHLVGKVDDIRSRDSFYTSLEQLTDNLLTKCS